MTSSPSRVFREVGGTALGLHMAERLAARLSGLWVAPFAVATLSTMKDDDTELPSFLVGDEIVLKPSGRSESFSTTARRGAHGKFPRFVGRPDHTWAEMYALIEPHLPAGSVAVVAQRIVSADGWPEPVIVHADGWEARVEFADGATRWLYVQQPDGAAEHYRTAGDETTVPEWCRPVADLHLRLTRELGFPINSEGVVGRDGTFGLVQFRPVPADAPVDHVLSCELHELRRADRLHRRTPFVWGVFDVTVDASALANGEQASVGGQPPVRLDVTGGFCLSHAAEHLPAPGPDRDAFRYIGLPGFAPAEFAGRRIRLISDGRHGGVVVL